MVDAKCLQNVLYQKEKGMSSSNDEREGYAKGEMGTEKVTRIMTCYEMQQSPSDEPKLHLAPLKF